jgi:hypothetical protein
VEVCDADPEVPEIVIVYVPAGVPVVVVVVLLLLHDGKSKSSTSSAVNISLPSTRRLRDPLPPAPRPNKARPATGNQAP